MELKRRRTFLVIGLCLIAAAASLAQAPDESSPTDFGSSGRQQSAPTLRTLTPDEGLAIIGAALEYGARSDSNADCSHFVHEIYERAGFSFSYASSSDLYAGTDDFRRVVDPQPGDLVVWLGHVGVVVNPAQRSFFSVLRSGLGISRYDSAYWRDRGEPHFLRYVTATTPLALR